MKSKQFDLKVTDELERRLALQQFDHLSSAEAKRTDVVIVQLLAASLLMVAIALLLSKVFG